LAENRPEDHDLIPKDYPRRSTGRVPLWAIMIIFLGLLGLFVYLVWPVVTPFVVWLALVLILVPFAYSDFRAISLIALITVAGVIYGVINLWEAFFPFVVALFLAFLLDPAADRLDLFYNRLARQERSEPPRDKRGARLRSLASLTVIVLTIGVIVGLAFLLVPTIRSDIARLQEFDFTSLVDRVDNFLGEIAGDSPQLQRAVQALTTRLQTAISEAIPDVAVLLENLLASLGNLGNLILIPIFTFLLLRDVDRMKKRVTELVPKRHHERMKDFGEDVNRVFVGFFRSKLVTCAFIGIVTGVGLRLIGVPFFIPLAVISGILNFIPFLGPVVAGAVAVPMAFFTADPPTAMLLTLALYVGAFTVSGYLLDPLVVGKRVGIGAVLLILSVLVGVQFGIIWAFLAVPIAALIKVIALQVERFYRRSPIYLGLHDGE
jgi:predicted PurR-regulated permease PerM